MSAALTARVIAVAMPHPAASRPRTATKTTSSAALMKHPLAMMRAGVRVSPTERSRADPMLSTREKTMAAA